MAKVTPRFEDNSGQVHDTPEQAVIADIAAALGRVGGDAGIAGGVAKLILDKRGEIERCFADLDRLQKPPAVLRAAR